MRSGRDWREDAACVSADPELFFPVGTDGPAVQAQIERARRVCSGCPVRMPCLQWALEVGVDGGMWGGYTETERRTLRRLDRQRRRRPATSTTTATSTTSTDDDDQQLP